MQLPSHLLLQVFAPALLHKHQMGEEQVKKNTRFANNMHQCMQEIIIEALGARSGDKRAAEDQTEARLLKIAKTAAAEAGIVPKPTTPPRVELQPVTGYARPGTVKLVWPSAGKGFQGLQDHWLFYKANLRDLLEVQKGKAAWEAKPGAFDKYKPLMTEISERSGASAARETAVLGVMHRLLQVPKVSILCIMLHLCLCFCATLTFSNSVQMSYGFLYSLVRQMRGGAAPQSSYKGMSLAEFEQMYNDDLKKAGLA